MSQAALLACLLLPAVLAALLWPRSTSRLALRLAPWAAAPALLLAMSAPQFSLEFPWLLLGTTLGIDETRRTFLLLTAGLWTAAGVYAGTYHAHDSRRRRYFTFHLLTLAGNLGLVVSLDAASFYLCFVTMSFAAYGMVIHAGTTEAVRAARVYIVLVLVGEAMILPGLWSAVSLAPTTALADVALGAMQAGPLTIALLAAGFGVKAGVVPLHLWLPLAHPAAPTPASAVLSGAMIKAGVMAWIGFLPFGQGALSDFAALFIVAGFLNAFFGAVCGICQSRPKTVLAYSSISQIGLVMIAVGIACLGGNAMEAALAAAALYCLHHGLAKGALFLGVGIVERCEGPRRRFAILLLAVPALTLAGLPLTTGFGAKLALKEAVYGLPAFRPAVELLLGVAATGTTLLMVRFLALIANRPAKATTPPAGMWMPWLALILAGLALAWHPGAPGTDWASLTDPYALWNAMWPILAGLAIVAAALAAIRRGARIPAIPEGDIVAPASRLIAAAGHLLETADSRRIAWWHGRKDAARPVLVHLRRRIVSWTLRTESRLMRGTFAALNLLILLGLTVVLATFG
jgi:hydrogenase-4 component B